MADRKVSITTSVNSEGTRPGFKDIESQAKKMAENVKVSGKQAGQGLADGISGGAGKAKPQLRTLEQSIKRSITRQTNTLKRQYAEIEAGSKNTVTYFKTYADQNGVAVGKLKKQLSDLVAMENKLSVASKHAADSLNESQRSMKGSTNAFGGQKYQVGNLVAQFQDVAVTSAMAMNPLQIALQQGTQISAAFGGQGAAKSVGLLRAGFAELISPMSLFTVGAVAAVAWLIQLVQKMVTTREKIKTVNDALSDFKSQVNGINVINISSGGIDSLIKKYGTLTSTIRNTLVEQTKLEIEMARFDAKTLVKSITSAFSNDKSEGGLELNPFSPATYQAPKTSGAGGYQNFLSAEYVTKLSNSTKILRDSFGLTEQKSIEVQKAIHNAFENVKSSNVEKALMSINGVMDTLSSSKLTDKQHKTFTQFRHDIGQAVLSMAELNKKEQDAAKSLDGFAGATTSRQTLQRQTSHLENAFSSQLKSLEREGDLLNKIRTQQASVNLLSDNYAAQMKEIEIKAQGVAKFEEQVARFKKEQVDAAGQLARQTAEQSGNYNESQIKSLVKSTRAAAAKNYRFDPTEFGLPSETTMEQAGLKLSQAYWAAWRENHTMEGTSVVIKNQMESWVVSARDTGKQIGDAITGSFDGAATALSKFIVTGKGGFKELANSIIQDLVSIALKRSVIAPIMGGLSSIFGFSGQNLGASNTNPFAVTAANGAVLNSGHLQAFAKGGLVDRPTIFPMAKGTGLMGEAGTEAIMPLTRDAKGRLGVTTSGAGMTPNVEVNVINQTSTAASASSTARYDETAKKFIVDVVLADYHRGGRVRDIIGGN